MQRILVYTDVWFSGFSYCKQCSKKVYLNISSSKPKNLCIVYFDRYCQIALQNVVPVIHTPHIIAWFPTLLSIYPLHTLFIQYGQIQRDINKPSSRRTTETRPKKEKKIGEKCLLWIKWKNSSQKYTRNMWFLSVYKI